MAWIDQEAMLIWADAGALVSEIEHLAGKSGLTLGPCAWWNKERKVVDLVRERSALRLNPMLCKVEEIVSAFEYRHAGQTHRTLSTPREACGPELRTLFYDAPETLTAVQLRLLPRVEERWLKVQGQDPRDAHGFIRAVLREGVAMRSLWSELSAAWLSFTGALAETLLQIAVDVAKARGLDAQPSQAPRGPELAPAFLPLAKTWETLGPRDGIVLADPWAVLVVP